MSGGLSEERRAAIRRYVIRGDRTREPVFVGRETEFTAVRNSIDAARDGYRERRTVCLSGPPGIGKTAFLTACHQRMMENPPTNGDNLIWTTVGSMDLRDPVAVTYVVADAINRLPDDCINTSRMVKRLKSFSDWMPEMGAEVTLNLAVAKLKAKMDSRRYQDKSSLSTTAGAPWWQLKELHSTVRDNPAIVICVDEAHGLRGSDGHLARISHQGAGTPIYRLQQGPFLIAPSSTRKRSRRATHSPVARNSGRCPRLASEKSSSRNNLG